MSLVSTLTGILLVLSNLAHAAPQNVLDYYRLIPWKHLASTRGGEAPFKDRDKAIQEKDIPNGYLRVEDAEQAFAVEVALFRKAGGGALIGLVIDDCGGCGDGYDQTILFVTYNNGQWIEQTKEVFPTITQPMLATAYRKRTGQEMKDVPGKFANGRVHLTYQLPRKGTTISVFAQYSKEIGPLLQLPWNGTRFTIADN